ncbi:MAG: SoxR reducing system RseC family protein [Oscillospiraceae bacterium]|nr:SoxR reducing system RseC family protein [Oscillospiraceae bacterium]
MRQRGTVEAAWDDTAIISVRRESACSGDCHKCAGCGAVTQTLQIRARNLIGARKGDKVYFESATGTVLWAAVLVYLMPILGFFLGYFVGVCIDATVLCGAVGFLLGWLPALWYNRLVKKRPPVYTLIGYVEQ